MGFSNTHRWSGLRLTLDDLRAIVARTEGLPGDTRVSVNVDPRTMNPADPGGTITISVTEQEHKP